MNLSLNPSTAHGYQSGSQIARRVTEAWASENLYCAACESNALTPAPCNAKAVDFHCSQCKAPYQLKASKSWNERRIPDAGYEAMVQAIRSDSVPNLLVMQYSISWQILNLMVIPAFFFNESAVEKRKPLALTARRAGWIGCNILLEAIAPQGKLFMVRAGATLLPSLVRDQYLKLRPLADLDVHLRGWTLDVLQVVQRIGRRRFNLQDVYACEPELAKLHPNNKHVRPKIRQQLQVLRDLGMLEFHGTGEYSLK